MTAEDLLATHLEELGEAFQRQYLYVPGRKYKADFALLQYKLLVEVQGGIYSKQAHGSVQGIIRDNERLNLASMLGWRVMRFTVQQVEWGHAKAAIRTAIHLAGEEAR